MVVVNTWQDSSSAGGGRRSLARECHLQFMRRAGQGRAGQGRAGQGRGREIDAA